MSYGVVDILKDTISGEVVWSEDELKKKRLEICTGCEHFIKTTKQCGKCGCFVSSKIAFKKSQCPIGKW